MRRKADRTKTTAWIDTSIIDFLKLRSGFKEIRFFVYVEANGWYEEVFGDTMYQAMQDDIMIKKYKVANPINKETSAKKIPRKKAPPEPKIDVLPKSVVSMGWILSEWIASKRILLSTMQRDVKVSLYEQMIRDVSHAAFTGDLNDEKIKEEMYTWLYCTWYQFFEKTSDANMNLLTPSSSESTDDSDSGGNDGSRPSDNHKKRKGNPKSDEDYKYDDDDYDPAADGYSGYAKGHTGGTVYDDDDCNDNIGTTSGYTDFYCQSFYERETA